MLNKRIHFIGIGGIGMSAIAQLCLKKGYRVSGSDIVSSENVKSLVKLGADIRIGHSCNNIQNRDLIVYSSAITLDNPELKEAMEQRMPILKRAEFLAHLMEEYSVIAVTGAHGKTTTSSLAAHLLIEANFSPTIAVGGIVANLSNNAKLGSSKFFVAEADESDGTFLFYKPKYSIITNIDREHMDFYKTFANIKRAFKKFITNTKLEGCVFWCFDDKEVAKIIKETKKRNLSFGLNKDANIYAHNIRLNSFNSEFNVNYKNRFLDEFQLSIPGLHNISNSLAVIALGLELGIDIHLIKTALSSFLGVKRRFQIKYSYDGITVIDDYAHHPTEIRTTIQTARGLNKDRLIVVFQPHRYTRMQYLLEQFSKSFFDADYVFITDIYPAGEEKIKGIDAKRLYRLMRGFLSPKTEFMDKDVLAKEILGFARKGDLLLFLGAGDINKISNEVVQELKRKSSV